MSRKEALLRLYDRLVAERESLRLKLVEDLGLAYAADDGINDLAETAQLDEQIELHTQLASMESREIREIDAAIDKIRDGSYGTCERCEKAIPIARLQAMPFTTMCIDCQRKRELNQSSHDDFEANWASAVQYERRSVDRELSLSDLDQGDAGE